MPGHYPRPNPPDTRGAPVCHDIRIAESASARSQLSAIPNRRVRPRTWKPRTAMASVHDLLRGAHPHTMTATISYTDSLAPPTAAAGTIAVWRSVRPAGGDRPATVQLDPWPFRTGPPDWAPGLPCASASRALFIAIVRDRVSAAERRRLAARSTIVGEVVRVLHRAVPQVCQ